MNLRLLLRKGGYIEALEGVWETDKVIQNIIEKWCRGSEDAVFDSNPQQLVEKLVRRIKNQKVRRVPV